MAAPLQVLQIVYILCVDAGRPTLSSTTHVSVTSKNREQHYGTNPIAPKLVKAEKKI